MCNCRITKTGEFTNQSCVKIPPHMENYKQARLKAGLSPYICIDNCILDEIRYLWELGIKTTGSCCGHNEQNGYIGVFPEDISKMKQLEYKVQYNPSRPNDEDSFYPKSV